MKWLCGLFLCISSFLLFAEPLSSATWGFQIDIPEDFSFVEGDAINSFGFQFPNGAFLVLRIYNDGRTLDTAVSTATRQLNNNGQIVFFDYYRKKAALLALQFQNYNGEGLCIELAQQGTTTPILLALVYSTKEGSSIRLFHRSVLNSIIPTPAEQLLPGPVSIAEYPRKTRISVPIYGTSLHAFVYDNDAEAAQAVVDMEFEVMNSYTDSPHWQNAWKRMYRMLYRDSFDRIANIAFMLERLWQQPETDIRVTAQQALNWVQSFTYERETNDSDFVNVVTAAIEGRGDCDSRVLLWAIVIEQAGIPSAIMVSKKHSHALGLADIPGDGARFPLGDKYWLVAETTDSVELGKIAKEMSIQEDWLGINF
ncbi:MAG: hypothetical protein LBQ77_04670 [Treponema sp.]|jgi:hypothetical protein|nr:hypothetical protein [Treponema sp.]